MEWMLGRKSWLIGGALLFGALALRKAMAFEVDFDPWADAGDYI